MEKKMLKRKIMKKILYKGHREIRRKGVKLKILNHR